MSSNKKITYKSVNALFQSKTGTEELLVILSLQFPVPTENNITTISSEDIKIISKIFKSYAEEDVWPNDIANCLRGVFRALRNSMAFNEVGQNLIHQESILSDICLMWDKIATFESLLHTCLQFLTNLVVRNKNSAEKVCEHLQTSIIHLLRLRICPEMAVSLYYNILLLQPPNLQVEIDILHHILVINEIKEIGITTSCLQNLLFNQNLILFYDSINKKHSIVILKVIQNAVEQQYKMTRIHITFIIDIFKARWQNFLSFYIHQESKTSLTQSLEVIHLVHILAALTSCEESLITLQTDQALFNDILFLFKSIHETGKLSQNVFTPINKLKDDCDDNHLPELEELRGFKATLIRIIGNMCNKHAINQNRIRELDGIGPLLDCCHIDSRNPCILLC